MITRLRSSIKFPDRWEIWESLDNGKTWRMVGEARKGDIRRTEVRFDSSYTSGGSDVAAERRERYGI